MSARAVFCYSEAMLAKYVKMAKNKHLYYVASVIEMCTWKWHAENNEIIIIAALVMSSSSDRLAIGRRRRQQTRGENRHLLGVKLITPLCRAIGQARNCWYSICVVACAQMMSANSRVKSGALYDGGRGVVMYVIAREETERLCRLARWREKQRHGPVAPRCGDNALARESRMAIRPRRS